MGDDAMFRCEIGGDVIPPSRVGSPTVDQNDRGRIRRTPGSITNSHTVDVDLVLVRKARERF